MVVRGFGNRIDMLYIRVKEYIIQPVLFLNSRDPYIHHIIPQ